MNDRHIAGILACSAFVVAYAALIDVWRPILYRLLQAAGLLP